MCNKMRGKKVINSFIWKNIFTVKILLSKTLRHIYSNKSLLFHMSSLRNCFDTRKKLSYIYNKC